MFAIQYRIGSKLIKQDVQQVDVDTLADAELVAVYGCACRLGVEELGIAHTEDLHYAVLIGEQEVGSFAIRSM